MDRKSLKIPFTRDRTPDWQCPRCHKGFLRFVKDKFHFEERKNSKDERDHEAWDPDWIEYVYSRLLQCNNESCGEFVASSGTGSVDFDVITDAHGEPEQVWIDFFAPNISSPLFS